MAGLALTAMLAAIVLTPAVATAADTPEPKPQTPFARTLASFSVEVQRSHKVSTEKEIDDYGHEALSKRGVDRLYSLWRVLFIYRDQDESPALQNWISIVRQRATQDKDAELAALAAFFQTCYVQIVRDHDGSSRTDFSRFLLHGGSNLRAMALYEEAEKENDAKHWSSAAGLASEGLREAAQLGPRTLALRAELHQAYSDALADMGYSQGAIEQLIEAVRLDLHAELPTRNLERLWGLATSAQAAGEVEFADKMAQLHFHYASAATHPYWTYYLCAEMAAAHQQWGRALACLHRMDAKLNKPKTQADASFLKWRAMARARLGDVEGARKDVDLLTGPLGISRLDKPTLELDRIYLQKAQGASGLAFEALDRWRRGFESSEQKLHSRQMYDVASALQAQLRRKSAESDYFAERAKLARRLSAAGLLIATLCSLLAVGCLAGIVHLRRSAKKLRAATRRAEAANDAKSRFLANMSHELRTPLNGMLGMTQALAAGGLTPDQADQVSTLHGASEALLVILNDVLDLAKIEADRMEIAPTSGDLAGICRSVAEVYRPAANANRNELRLRIEPGLSRSLVFDGLRVRQCLSNLIANAVKFTEGGDVEMTVSQALDEASGRVRVTVAVADTGVGMSAETLGRLFGAFVQANDTTSRPHGGTGLGLSITQRLAGLMGGAVTVRSEPGRGSVFTLTFLADPDPSAVEAPPSEARGQADASARIGTASEGPLEGLKVLVVDDHPVNRKVATLLLKTFGCEIIEAEDGVAALQQLETQPVDLVLMDINMPVMDGLEATRRIRADARWPDLAVLALTAGASEEHCEVCMAAGMDGYLAKPIGAAALFTAISKLIAAAQPAHLSAAAAAA